MKYFNTLKIRGIKEREVYEFLIKTIFDIENKKKSGYEIDYIIEHNTNFSPLFFNEYYHCHFISSFEISEQSKIEIEYYVGDFHWHSSPITHVEREEIIEKYMNKQNQQIIKTIDVNGIKNKKLKWKD